jgi:hypothetical protein
MHGVSCRRLRRIPWASGFGIGRAGRLFVTLRRDTMPPLPLNWDQDDAIRRAGHDVPRARGLKTGRGRSRQPDICPGGRPVRTFVPAAGACGRLSGAVLGSAVAGSHFALRHLPPPIAGSGICRLALRASAFAGRRFATRHLASAVWVVGICRGPGGASAFAGRRFATRHPSCVSGTWQRRSAFAGGGRALGHLSGPISGSDICPGAWTFVRGVFRPGHLSRGSDICPGLRRKRTFVRATDICSGRRRAWTFVRPGPRRGGSGQPASDCWAQAAARKSLTPIQPPGICRGLRHLPWAVGICPRLSRAWTFVRGRLGLGHLSGAISGSDICPRRFSARTFVRAAGHLSRAPADADICPTPQSVRPFVRAAAGVVRAGRFATAGQNRQREKNLRLLGRFAGRLALPICRGRFRRSAFAEGRRHLPGPVSPLGKWGGASAFAEGSRQMVERACLCTGVQMKQPPPKLALP